MKEDYIIKTRNDILKLRIKQNLLKQYKANKKK